MSEIFQKKRNERRKADLIIYRTEDEVYKALIEVVVFGIFLITTTTLALNCRNIYEYYTNDSYRRLLLPRDNIKKFTWELESITNVESWWSYITDDFFEKKFILLNQSSEQSDKERDPLGLKNKKTLWDSNLLLRAPILFQIRVKPSKCKRRVFLNGYPTKCYGKYDPSVQADDPLFKGTSYIDVEDTDMLPTWATLRTYRGGGYFQRLSADKKETMTMLEYLEKIDWIDGGTRFVLLSLELFNYNMGMLSSIKILTEVLATGNIVSAFVTHTLSLDSIWSPNSPGMLITACVFYFIVTYNMGNEIYEIISFGFKEYIKVVWNYIDWGIIITAYISLGCSIAHPFLIAQYLRDIEDQNKLACLDRVILCDSIFVGAISLCTFQSWIRIFRFISFNQTMLSFNMALRRCAPEIISFLVILVIFFNVFGVMGLLAFGIENPDFQNYATSFFFMFRLMLHDFDYNNFHEASPIWGPIYLMFYVSIVVFILVNMFLAIISQTYIDVKQIAQERQIAIKSVFLGFIYKIEEFLNRILIKLSLKRQSTEERESKKIQFKDDLTDESDTEKSPRKSISKIEALNEYYGIGRKVSLSSRDSVKSSDTYGETKRSVVEYDDEDEDVEDIDLARRNTTAEFISRLRVRLDLLDVAFAEMSNDMDSILAMFETKARKTLTMPKPD